MVAINWALKPIAVVNLSREEVSQGVKGGYRRWMKSQHLQNVGGYNPTPLRDWHTATYGALAEVAAAKWLGMPMPEVHEGTFKTVPDLAPDFEVRHTSRCGLILRPGDLKIKDRRFILVTNEHPGTFAIWGWTYGWAVAKDKFLAAPDKSREKNCWEFPRSLLYRIKPDFAV
jgi:hypothetical protein